MLQDKISKIIIHCTATPADRDVTVGEIDRWHRARGFNGIGYHYLISLDGRIHRGRSESIVGAHCSGHNYGSLGIVYAGGMEPDGIGGYRPADTRTEAQKRALRDLIARLLERHPRATVHGHREFANKACPCFDVHTDL